MGLRRLSSSVVGMRVLSVATLVCALGAALTLACASAWAGTTHKPLTTFGSFQSPQALAVQQASGDVLVVDAGAQRVERFTAAGVPDNFSALGSNAIDGHGGGECATVPADCDETPQNGFELAGPGQAQVAVDESAGATKGEIYVTDSYHAVVDIFAADGHYLGQLSGTHTSGFGTVCGVAVDGAGNVFVSDENGQIHRFQPYTNPIKNEDSVGDINASACELALDSSGDIFATQPFGGPVNKYDSAGNFQYALDANNATGVAVDPSTQDVYAAEGAKVAQFDASTSIGAALLGTSGAGTLGEASGVGVNGAGELFVGDAQNKDVVVFGSGVAAPDATTGAATNVTGTKATVEGGVNPDGTVTEWQFQYGTDTSYGSTAPASPESAGNGSSEVPVSTELSGLTAGTTYHYRLIAIGANGTTYGADQSFTTQAAPSVDSESASPVAKTTATLGAQINPWGAETTYHFEYGSSESYGTSTPDTVIPAGWGDQAATAEITGLIPGATYHYRVVATNSLGGPVDGPDQTFTTTLIATFRDIYATKLTTTEATLNAEINPLGEATTYRFEYGPTEAYGSSVPVPDGNVAGEEVEKESGLLTVSQAVTGLSENTTYHYRVVATNAAGTVQSTDQTFTTRTVEVAQADTCPNAKVRAEQGSSSLPECRAYEMVSPPDKNGTDITAEGAGTLAATNGGAIAYLTPASFGDTSGSGQAGKTVYVSRRGVAGWSSHAITPTPNYGAEMVGLVGDTAIGDFSPDLRHALVTAFELPRGSGAVPNAYNIYVLDTVTSGLQLVSEPPLEPFNPVTFVDEFLFPTFGAVSSDAEHVAFSSTLPYTEPVREQVPAGVPSVYEWDNGTIRLASILPEGKIASSGAKLAPPKYRGTVSPDGSHVLFISPVSGSTGQLYARVDHERTVWISEPETSSPSPAPKNVLLQEVAGDSRHVIFTTTSKLVDEDTNAGSDIYLYSEGADPAKEKNLTLITNSGTIPPTTAQRESTVVGSSSDGKLIYYYFNGTFYLWDEGVTRVVASGVKYVTAGNLQYSATASSPGVARVTSDGNYLGFMTPSENPIVTDGHGRVAGDSAGRGQVYLYSADTDSLRCASCPSSGPARSVASIVPNVTNMGVTAILHQVRPSFLASDGRVFFSTADALVPGDVNGVTDAYQFDPATGRVSLISTGRGSQPAAFMDASENGEDVFFATRAQLVGWDRDGLVDIYDARVKGGFAEPVSPHEPCGGERCQGPLTAQPAGVEPGSSLFAGSEPATSPSLRMRVLSARVVGARALLRIAAPSAGTIAWVGGGMVSGHRRVSAAGTYTVTVALTRSARRRLAHRRTVRVSVRVTFTPPGGPPGHATVSLTFKGSSSKRGR